VRANERKKESLFVVKTVCLLFVCMYVGLISIGFIMEEAGVAFMVTKLGFLMEENGPTFMVELQSLVCSKRQIELVV